MSLSIFSISASGMSAERLRMDVIANNIANAHTTRDANGEPFRRKIPVFQEKILEQLEGKGRLSAVRVDRIVEDMSPFKMRFDPSHPDADENGYVRTPNVDVMKEMVDLISSSRGYEANLAVISTVTSLYQQALSIIR